MKRIYILAILSIALIFCSCSENNKELEKLQGIISNLEASNKDLTEKNHIKRDEVDNLKTSLKIKNKTINELNTELRKLQLKIDNIENLRNTKGNMEDAIIAIEYELRMYHSTVEYKNIRAVQKSDGSYDVIVDIIIGQWMGTRPKYYNVTTFKDGTYTINKEWGTHI